MREFVKVTKAISDENRLRILMFLQKNELCLCQIIGVLELASSTVSKHMSILFDAGLVEARKEGRWRYFRLSKENGSQSIRDVIDWINRSLSGNPTVAQDHKKLKTILKTPVEKYCCSIKKD